MLIKHDRRDLKTLCSDNGQCPNTKLNPQKKINFALNLQLFTDREFPDREFPDREFPNNNLLLVFSG